MVGEARRRQATLLEEVRGQIVSMCRHVAKYEFQHWTVDRHVERYFSARFPPKGSSERDAPVGVPVGQNGGRRKISSKKVVGARVF